MKLIQAARPFWPSTCISAELIAKIEAQVDPKEHRIFLLFRSLVLMLPSPAFFDLFHSGKIFSWSVVLLKEVLFF